MSGEKILANYKKAAHTLPDFNLSWPLYDKGLDNIGKDGAPVAMPLPEIEDDQLLVRVDSVGLCFSDIKLITQGNKHPRIFGRDLQTDPVIPGHEASMTVVKVGDKRKDNYKVGERYLIQADVFYQGKSIAFGYVLPGALQQYTVLGPEILDGDEGSYILPMRDEDGYAEVALSEPWACVVAAYRITRRETLKPGGRALFVLGDDKAYTTKGAISTEGGPKQVVVLGQQGEAQTRLLQEFGEIAAVADGGKSLDELNQSFAGGQGFDDIVFCGTPSSDMLEAAVKVLALRGVMAILAETPLDRKVSVDIGRVHYDGHIYTGGNTTSIAEAYQQKRSAKLIPGGNTWMIGAGGPMGQMHTQMAAEDPNGPKLIVVTENNVQRLEELKKRFGPAAKARGARLVGFSPRQEGMEQVEQKIKEVLGGELFDDIVVNAPSAAVVEDGPSWLKDDGLLNVFAGVPRGTMGEMDVSKVYLQGHRWVGSSGSSLADLAYTLEQIQTKTLRTDRSVAAIAGLNAAQEGLHGVKDGSFPGKIVVWPQLPDLPLIALPDLEKHLPNVAAKLSSDGYWTKEAEDELLSSQLALD